MGGEREGRKEGKEMKREGGKRGREQKEGVVRKKNEKNQHRKNEKYTTCE